jgi:succinate-acetate transporter protein
MEKEIYVIFVPVLIIVLTVAYYWIIVSLIKIKKDNNYRDMPDFSLFWTLPAFIWAFRKETHQDERVESLRKAIRYYLYIFLIFMFVFSALAPKM